MSKNNYLKETEEEKQLKSAYKKRFIDKMSEEGFSFGILKLKKYQADLLPYTEFIRDYKINIYRKFDKMEDIIKSLIDEQEFTSFFENFKKEFSATENLIFNNVDFEELKKIEQGILVEEIEKKEFNQIEKNQKSLNEQFQKEVEERKQQQRKLKKNSLFEQIGVFATDYKLFIEEYFSKNPQEKVAREKFIKKLEDEKIKIEELFENEINFEDKKKIEGIERKIKEFVEQNLHPVKTFKNALESKLKNSKEKLTKFEKDFKNILESVEKILEKNNQLIEINKIDDEKDSEIKIDKLEYYFLFEHFKKQNGQTEQIEEIYDKIDSFYKETSVINLIFLKFHTGILRYHYSNIKKINTYVENLKLEEAYTESFFLPSTSEMNYYLNNTLVGIFTNASTEELFNKCNSDNKKVSLEDKVKEEILNYLKCYKILTEDYNYKKFKEKGLLETEEKVLLLMPEMVKKTNLKIKELQNNNKIDLRTKEYKEMKFFLECKEFVFEEAFSKEYAVYILAYFAILINKKIITTQNEEKISELIFFMLLFHLKLEEIERKSKEEKGIHVRTENPKNLCHVIASLSKETLLEEIATLKKNLLLRENQYFKTILGVNVLQKKYKPLKEKEELEMVKWNSEEEIKRDPRFQEKINNITLVSKILFKNKSEILFSLPMFIFGLYKLIYKSDTDEEKKKKETQKTSKKEEILEKELPARVKTFLDMWYLRSIACEIEKTLETLFSITKIEKINDDSHLKETLKKEMNLKEEKFGDIKKTMECILAELEKLEKNINDSINDISVQPKKIEENMTEYRVLSQNLNEMAIINKIYQQYIDSFSYEIFESEYLLRSLIENYLTLMTDDKELTYKALYCNDFTSTIEVNSKIIIEKNLFENYIAPSVEYLENVKKLEKYLKENSKIIVSNF